MPKIDSEVKLKKMVAISNGMKGQEFEECWEFLRMWLRESTERPNVSIDSLTRGNFNDCLPKEKLMVFERLKAGAAVGMIPQLVLCASFMVGFFQYMEDHEVEESQMEMFKSQWLKGLLDSVVAA